MGAQWLAKSIVQNVISACIQIELSKDIKILYYDFLMIKCGYITYFDKY
jgi:hypothetical protein